MSMDDDEERRRGNMGDMVSICFFALLDTSSRMIRQD